MHLSLAELTTIISKTPALNLGLSNRIILF